MTEELVNLICDLAEEMEGIDPEVAERFYKKGQEDLLSELWKHAGAGTDIWLEEFAAKKGIEINFAND